MQPGQQAPHQGARVRQARLAADGLAQVREAVFIYAAVDYLDDAADEAADFSAQDDPSDEPAVHDSADDPADVSPDLDEAADFSAHDDPSADDPADEAAVPGEGV